MIEPVEQTDFHRLESTTRGSLARQVVAEAIRRKRRDYRWWLELVDRYGDDHHVTVQARGAYISSQCSAESLRRILYGWEL